MNEQRKKPINRSLSHLEVRHRPFEIPEKLPRYWYNDNVAVTHMFNAASVQFPQGEKFFIDAVRHFKPKIKDEKLRADIDAFIGQEAHHSKAHIQYNYLLDDLGYDVAAIEGKLGRKIKKLKRIMNMRRQLAVVVAYEHFTALFGDSVLRHPEWFKDVDPKYAAIWYWHAVEEVEHKAVAFDVYKAIGGGYWMRILGILVASTAFNKDLLTHTLAFIKQDKKLSSPKVWWQAFKFLFIHPASVFQMLPGYLRYFSPWFHPNKHDNLHLTEAWKKEYNENKQKQAQNLQKQNTQDKRFA